MAIKQNRIQSFDYVELCLAFEQNRFQNLLVLNNQTNRTKSFDSALIIWTVWELNITPKRIRIQTVVVLESRKDSHYS